MTQEQQRIAIAEACGWKQHPDRVKWNWLRPNGRAFNGELPNYLSDLNAMHEAEKMLTPQSKANYSRELQLQLNIDPIYYGDPDDSELFRLLSVTAAQRAEAFLRTLNLWTE